MSSSEYDDDTDWSWTPDETGMVEEPVRCVTCHRTSFEACCCCGAPLCPMCFETGAGFCGGTACMTEENIAAMEQQLRGEEEEAP